LDFFAGEEESRALVAAALAEGVVLLLGSDRVTDAADVPPDDGTDAPRRLLAVDAAGASDDGAVTLDLPKERDGVLLLGSLAFRCSDAVEEPTRRRSGTIRGLLRDLGDHRVVVRSAAGQVRVAHSVRATDGARELFDLGWQLRQEGSPNIAYLIG
jgi:hypothetical protein